MHSTVRVLHAYTTRALRMKYMCREECAQALCTEVFIVFELVQRTEMHYRSGSKTFFEMRGCLSMCSLQARLIGETRSCS